VLSLALGRRAVKLRAVTNADRLRLAQLRGAMQPTQDEARRMLADLVEIVGDYWAARLIDVDRRRLRAYLGGAMLSGPRLALLWRSWAAVVRPGSVASVLDLVTFGRFTIHADPATAGKGRAKYAPRSPTKRN
jgi:hypothetical protein